MKKSNLHQHLQSEQGQSVVLIALGLAVLMAFMALAVDGGSVYAQRRQVQNAVDAASSAAGERLARHDPSNNGRATNGQIYDLIKKYLRQNGVNVDSPNINARNLSVRYITRDSANATHVDGAEITSYGTNFVAPLKIPLSTGDPVVGVQVTVDKEFNSYFARIIGINTMQVGAMSPGFGAPIVNNKTPAPETTGACCADDLFPIALNQAMFTDYDNDGNLDVIFEEGSPTEQFTIWLRQDTAPNFRFVRWKNQSDNSSTLQSNMNTVANSGTWYVQEWVQRANVTMSNVHSTFQSKVGQTLTVPVYDSVRNSNTEYQIVGFARIHLVGACNSSQASTSTCPVANAAAPYIQVRFEQWASSRCEGSCAFFGVRTNKPRDEQPQERALIGVVKLNVHELENISFEQRPVDVVHVLDISGSMQDCIGQPNSSCANSNQNQKLRLAKNALITFNSIVSPTLGDRIGLATFPTTQSTSNYSMPCGGNYNVLMFGRNGSNGSNGNLTSNIGTPVAPYNPSNSMNKIIDGLSANSGTPIAGGMIVGRQIAAGHAANSQSVIILASDGMANVRTNGRWTGYPGSIYEDLPCNGDAVQDAIAEANLAKQDNNRDGRPDIIVFTIAIGTDFNPYVLEAMASEPAASHFYQISTAAAMRSIYEQIATRLQTGDCTASDHEEFAAGASIRVRNTTTGQVLTTTASSTGYFEFRNITPGTYRFESVSVSVGGLTYDIFTQGVGGPILEQNPTVEVGDAPISYDVSLALETDEFEGSCP